MNRTVLYCAKYNGPADVPHGIEKENIAREN